MTTALAISGRAIVEALGGKWTGNQGRCRCPVHEGTAFTVVEKAGKVLVHCWAGCSQDDVITGLRGKGLWHGRPDDAGRLTEEDRAALRARREAAEKAQAEEMEARAEDAQRIWKTRQPIAGTLAEAYLRNRGIKGKLPPSLGFVASLKHAVSGLSFPALLGAVQSGDRRVTGIQRIYLDPHTAGKALVSPNKMTFGVLGDGAVRLARGGRLLGLAEGIETALSAARMFSLPVWAVLGAGRLGSVTLPDDVLEVAIFADRGEVGEREAEKAADLYGRQGMAAHVVLPDPGFGDFNDMLRGRAGVAA